MRRLMVWLGDHEHLCHGIANIDAWPSQQGLLGIVLALTSHQPFQKLLEAFASVQAAPLRTVCCDVA